MTNKKTVVYLCTSNAGKSQMAEALHKMHSKDIDAYSAGVSPKTEVNEQSAEAVGKLGADMGDRPKGLSDVPLETADRVIILGKDAQLDMPGVTAERWLIDEPSLRGIEGEERMDLIAAEIEQRVQELLTELS